MIQLKSLMTVCIAGALFSGCGLNPFGPGQTSLSLFAKVGKAMQKPSAIHDEQNSKENQQATVAAKGMSKRLAKSTASPSDLFVIAKGLDNNSDGSYTYWEQVRDKPSEEDAQKLVTGRGEITFTYNSSIPLTSIDQIDTNKILGIASFHFIGRNVKTWNSETDSMDILVAFKNPLKIDPTPGRTTVWAKNISSSIDLGKGDTASFILDSLNTVESIQYGQGSFYDAHTGRDNSGEAYAFNFGVSIDHNGTYGDYLDNEGDVNFGIPWKGGDTDSLHFEIHFYQAGTYKRTGVITDDNGTVRVEFTHFEKPSAGTNITTYYDKNGKLLNNE